MKKVALVGNAANNFFSACRYLRDAGFDARLFLFEEEEREWPHFSPECDSFTDSFNDYVEKSFFSKHPTPFFHYPSDKIKNFWRRFDFIIGSSALPAYASKAGVKLDLFVPYGSDLYYLPFFKKRKGLKSTLKHAYLSYHQRKGIRSSQAVWFDRTNAKNEALLAKLKIKGNRIMMNFPFIYLPEYAREKLAAYCDKSVNFKAIYNAKKRHDFLVFHHCRHEWCTVSKQDLAYKGNDKIIRAVKEFVKKHPDTKPLVVFLEYGTDVIHSKTLIRELGLEEYFIWLPKIPRKEIMLCLTLADLGIGELGHSWFSYSVVFEFLASGVPVIHRRDDHLYSDRELFPMVYARNTEDLIQVFSDFVSNKEKFTQIGRCGKEWLESNGVNKPLSTLINLINMG